jgi:two-component system sensor histidine kinase YesM
MRDHVSTQLRRFEYLMYQIVVDRDLNFLVDRYLAQSPETRSDLIDQIKRIFTVYSYSENDILSAAYIARDGTKVVSLKLSDSYFSNDWNDPVFLSKLHDAGERSPAIRFLPTVEVQMAEPIRQKTFHIVMQARDLMTKADKGVFVLGINERMLSSIVAPPSPDGPRREVKSLIVDQDNRVVWSPDAAALGTTVAEADREAFLRAHEGLGPGPLIVQAAALDPARWTLITAVERDAFFEEINLSVRVTTLTMVAVLILTIGGILLFVRSLYSTVSRVVTAMNQVETGDFTVELSPTRNDEIADVFRGFNQMVARLKEEREQILTEVRKRREAEISVLEAQINPHFLYNTLDSIHWIAMADGSPKTGELLARLGKLLYYAFDRSQTPVTLEEELAWLDHYVFLQAARFEDAFSCRSDIDPRTRSFRMRKLILQPLVENAILHGFEGRTSGGILTIRSRLRDDGWLELVVEDNGQGIAPDRADEIRRGETDRTGLANVATRLRAYYGDAASFTFHSVEGGGTAFVLGIPS